MANQWNIKPYHGNLISIGSNSTHTAETDFYTQNPKSYQVFSNLGSTSSHTTLKSSSYQYLTSLVTPSSSFVLDTGVLNDSFVVNITTFIEEDGILFDSLSSGNTVAPDTGILADSMTTNITTNVIETILLDDSDSNSTGQDEQGVLADSFVTNIVTYITEGLVGVDNEQSGIIYNSNFSFEVRILEYLTRFYSFETRIPLYLDEPNTFQVSIQPYTNQGVTSIFSPASSFTNTPASSLPPSLISYSYYNYTPPNPPPYIPNPFSPTIIVGGNQIVANSSTYPIGYTPTANSYFVQYLNPQVGLNGSNLCSTLNLNVSLDYSGGEFDVTVAGVGAVGPGPTGGPLNLLGLQGTITAAGATISNSLYGSSVSGIFAPINMNKTLDILCAANPYLLGVLTNQNTSNTQFSQYQQLLQQSGADLAFNVYVTYQSAALAIANLAGVGLSWNIPDFPLVTLNLSEGDTALSALSGLASQVGGTLRWDGYNHYTVCYPNFVSGSFTVPDSSLITGQGISYKYLLDLDTDTSGVGLRAVNRILIVNPTQKTLALAGGVEAVQQLGSVRKVFSDQDPPQTFPLPQDYGSAKIQILVTDNSADPVNFVTSDPTQWFDLGDAGLGNPYVKLGSGSVNGSPTSDPYAPYISIDSTLFSGLTNNNAINNGNFVLNVGCTRIPPSTAYSNAVQARQQQLNNMLLQTVNRFRYVKAYEGSISCYFHGAIPLPGFWASATACGTTVQGIIESVSFTSPGILNITVAQYAEIMWINQLTQIYAAGPGQS